MFKQEYEHLAFFKGMSLQQLRDLEPLFEIRSFSKDQIIFEQGQPAEYLYILCSGEILVRYKPYDGPPLTVARILPGNVCGWSTALRRTNYSSEAVAVLPSEAYCITRHQLVSICDECPETGKIFLDRLTEEVANRYRNIHPQVLSILSGGMESNDDHPGG